MEPATTLTVSCQGATTVSIDELVDLQGDLKDLTEENYVKLRNSMTKFGFSFPFYMWVDTDGTKYITDGHQRIRTLRKMRSEGIAIPELPADYVYAKDKQEAKQKLLLLNSQYGKFTQEGWDAFTFDINMDEINDLLVIPDMSINFTDPSQDTSDVIEDEAPEVSQEPAISELGKVYQLGRHRLMCGDATKIEDVERLMNGQKADMVFTDPPYGVDYSGLGQNTSNKIENDNLSVEDTETLVRESLANAFVLSSEGATCFVWHADGKPGLRPAFEKAFTESGWRLSSTIIWAKTQASMGFQDYRSQHEPCLYGWKGTKSERVSDRTQTTLWNASRDSNYEHPTQKPVYLSATAISNHMPKIVLDLFGGSGSTLMGCEQKNSTCYTMELDPKYCDVIRKRYAKFIGNEDWQAATPEMSS